GRLGEEAPTRHAGARGQRHAGLDLRQALAGRSCATEVVGDGAVVTAHRDYAVWRSGEVAISRRSAVSTLPASILRLSCAAAKDSSRPCVVGVIVGAPQDFS